MSDFYIRDELGRFSGIAAAGPAARSFESFFQEVKTRPGSPSGWVMVREPDGTLSKVYVEAGHPPGS